MRKEYLGVMRRRELVGGVALAAWGQEDRLRRMLEELSEIGRPAGGSIRSGVSRVG